MSRNVVLICLDSVRKDVYDEVARRLRERTDVSFEACRAASTWSVPSHASMVTGELPHQHGIHAHHRDFTGLTRADTFLGGIPHHAASVSANVYASSAFGFDGIFDASLDISPDRRFPAGLDVARFGQANDADGIGKYAAFVRACLGHEHPLQSFANGVLVQLNDLLTAAPVPKPMDDGAKVVSRAARTSVDAAPEPFFLFANYMDAHGPLTSVLGFDRDRYTVPNNWSSDVIDGLAINAAGDLAGQEAAVENHRALYRAAVEYLDRQVSAFVDWVQARTTRETTVVITADHGENLGYPGDDGLWEHSYGMTEALLHVPLAVVNAPTGYEAEISAPVSHLDLGRLVQGLANGEAVDITREQVPAERIGSNINRLPEMSPEERRRWDPMIRCVYDGETRIQWDSGGTVATYRVDPTRPSWQERLAEGTAVDARALDAEWFDVPIEEYKRAAEAADTGPVLAGVDGATRQRLEDLGYL